MWTGFILNVGCWAPGKGDGALHALGCLMMLRDRLGISAG